jgi:hypothetical protein
VWETAVELDPMSLYTLMLGGPDAAGVVCVQSDVSALTPAQLVATCAPDPTKNAYTMHAKGPSSPWMSQGTVSISYPSVP